MQHIVCLSVWFTSFPFPLIVVRVLTQTKYSHVQFIVSWTLPYLVGQMYCMHSTAFLINYIHMLFGCDSPGFNYLTLSVILTVSLSFFAGHFYWFAEFFRTRNIPAIYSTVSQDIWHRWYKGGTLIIHSGSPSSTPRSNKFYVGADKENLSSLLHSVQKVI